MPMPTNAPKYKLVLTESKADPKLRFDHTKLSTDGIPDLKDMEHRMAPVFDQGSLGSCTGNAFVGALEYLENKRHNLTNEDHNFVDLSRLFVYFNERLLEGSVDVDAGAFIADGIKALSTRGVCREKFYPYDINRFKEIPSPEAYADGENRQITKFAQVDMTEEAFVATLGNSIPIVFGIQIFKSFESDDVARTGMVPMPTANEECLGGHAVLVCGYSQSKRLLKVRNSWGADWGVRGYFFLPFDYVFKAGLASEPWIIDDMEHYDN